MAEPQGVSLPARLTGEGGFVWVTGEDFVREIVVRAVSPNYSDNPFESIPMDEDAVFKMDDPSTRVRVLDALRRGFAYLERIGLARATGTRPFVFRETGVEGEAEVQVSYTNLKTQDPGVLTRRLRFSSTT